MLRYLLVLCCCFSFCCQVQAQTAAGATATLPPSLLWEISGNGLTQSSYLYGTMHLLCKDEIQLHPGVQAAMQQCKQLYLEMDMDDPQLVSRLQKKIIGGAGYSYKALFTPAEYEEVHRYFKDSLRVDISQMNRMIPLAISGMMAAALLPCKQKSGVEDTLMKLAKGRQLEVKGLEAVEDQILLYDSIPDREEAKATLEMVRQLDEAKARFRQMSAYYQSEDIQALYQLVESSKDIAPYRVMLLDNRNRKWIPVIREQIGQQPTFIAVGTGHLAGAQGVIQLLRSAGYRVTPVLR